MRRPRPRCSKLPLLDVLQPPPRHPLSRCPDSVYVHRRPRRLSGSSSIPSPTIPRPEHTTHLAPYSPRKASRLARYLLSKPRCISTPRIMKLDTTSLLP